MEQGPDLEYAISEQQAACRAKRFKRFDPFPDIPPALLSSADIEDYARVTAMLFPFANTPEVLRDVLKPASYEVRPGNKFVWWRDDGERVEDDIHEDGTYAVATEFHSDICKSNLRSDCQITLPFDLTLG